MLKSVLTVAALATMSMASAAQAITFPTRDLQSQQLAGPIFTGVGRLINSASSNRHVCTASLVSSNVVITAQHCLDAGSDLRFTLEATAASAAQTFSVSNFQTLTSFDGSGTVDMAMLTLDGAVTDREIYELYDGSDEIGQVVTLVGGGMTGLLGTGLTADDYYNGDYRVRYGVNTLDAYYADEGRFIMDFDNGNPDNDVLGRLFGLNDTGVRDAAGNVIDVGIAYGDSGGAAFIGKRIAGINVNMGSGTFFDGSGGRGCGRPGAVDPVAPSALFGCHDASYGDIGISVRTSLYIDQARAYISGAAVPEPATWAMMLAGFGFVGASMRRGRSVARVAA